MLNGIQSIISYRGIQNTHSHRRFLKSNLQYVLRIFYKLQFFINSTRLESMYNDFFTDDAIMMIVGVKSALFQLYRHRLTLLLWPKTGDRIYMVENDGKERWSDRHLTESNPVPPVPKVPPASH